MSARQRCASTSYVPTSDNARDRDGLLNQPPHFGTHVVQAVIRRIAQVQHHDLRSELAAKHVRRNHDNRRIRHSRAGDHAAQYTAEK
jgi:hypothetical protein